MIIKSLQIQNIVFYFFHGIFYIPHPTQAPDLQSAKQLITPFSTKIKVSQCFASFVRYFAESDCFCGICFILHDNADTSRSRERQTFNRNKPRNFRRVSVSSHAPLTSSRAFQLHHLTADVLSKSLSHQESHHSLYPSLPA